MKKITPKQTRLSLVLVPPVIFFLLAYFSSFYYLKIPPIESSSVSYNAEQSSVTSTTRTSNFKNLFLTAFNIPFPKFQYKACLINHNEVSVSLGGTFPDPHTVSSSTQIGAMVIKFLREEGSPRELYALMGSTSCVMLADDDISSGQVAVQSNFIILSQITKNGILQSVPTTTSKTDTSKSKLYAYMLASNAIWLFFFFLVGWCGLILLWNGIYKFIKHGS